MLQTTFLTTHTDICLCVFCYKGFGAKDAQILWHYAAFGNVMIFTSSFRYLAMKARYLTRYGYDTYTRNFPKLPIRYGLDRY